MNETAKVCACGCGTPVAGTFVHGHNRRKPPLEPKLCACGCGEYARVDQAHRVASDYIHGHARPSEETRKKISEAKRFEKNRAPLVPKLCACGCGEYAAVDERRNRVAKYVSGHNAKVAHPMKGKCHTDETKAALAEKTRQQMERAFPGGSLRSRLRHDHPGTHSSWHWMMSRCFDSWNASYPNYGGAGITVCERWLKFENFYADMGERPDGKTLDRIDGTGHYEPGNCRWATKAEQSANRRNGWIKRRANQALVTPAPERR